MPHQYTKSRSNGGYDQDAADKKAADADRANRQRELDRMRAEAVAERKAKTEQLRALEARLQRLESARADCSNVISTITAKDNFAATFVGKMYEIPSHVGVHVPAGTWGGASASAFAGVHNDISEKITGAATSSIGTLSTFRSKLSDSQLKLHAAVSAIAIRIAEVTALIATTKGEINALTSRIASIPATAN